MTYTNQCFTTFGVELRGAGLSWRLSHARDRAKQPQILDLLARFDLPRRALRQRGLDLLPKHTVGQHRQEVAQIDHPIPPVAEEIIGHGVT